MTEPAAPGVGGPTPGAPSARPAPRSRFQWVWKVGQVALGIAVLYFLWRVLSDIRAEMRREQLVLQPQWGYIIGASVGVFSGYLLLVQVWRVLLRSWGERATYTGMGSIWFVSNLGRYLPGRVWALGTMAVMAQHRGIAPASMVSCAVFVVLINIIAGVIVLLGFSPELMNPLLAEMGFQPNKWVGVGVGVAALLTLWWAPAVLPRLLSRISVLIRRPVDFTVSASRRATLEALAGSAAAWILYGVSFALFARGLFPGLPGRLSGYIGVFTGSYLLGFVAFMFPAGVVVRELALGVGMNYLRMATPAEAAALALTSRLWLTILETAPGLLILSYNAVARRAREGRRS